MTIKRKFQPLKKRRGIANVKNPSAMKTLARMKGNARTEVAQKHRFGTIVAKQHRQEAAVREVKEKAFRAAKARAKKKGVKTRKSRRRMIK